MRSLARWLAEHWFSAGMTQADVAGADRAAELAKCDLVTEMVREFTELQGIVGGLYAQGARRTGRNCLGRLRSVQACWVWTIRCRGILPDARWRSRTSSIRSWRALRWERFPQVQVILSLCGAPRWELSRSYLNVNFRFRFRRPFRRRRKVLKEQQPHIEASDAVQKQVLEFLLERARYILKERRGFAYDEINAAFAAGSDDLVDAVGAGSVQCRPSATRRTFAPLAASFKRIRNILEKSAGKGDRVQGGGEPGTASGSRRNCSLQTVAQRVGRKRRDRRRKRNIERRLRKFRSCARRWTSSSTRF